MAEDKDAPAIPPAVIAQAEAAAEANAPASHPTPSGQSANLQPPTEGTKAPAPATKASALGDTHGELDISQDGMDTKANVASDGRVNIHINQRTRRLSNLLVPALRNQLEVQKDDRDHADLPPAYIPPSLGGLPGQQRPPKLNVVIQIVGSRGDVQPFVALGKVLKADYGHRVRIATHGTFKSFVEENGLEFFCIGGDPAELMAFMVKNPGLLPGFDTLKTGDVGKRRKGIYEILQGCWRSCIESGDGTSPAQAADFADDSTSFDSGISLQSHIGAQPFIADAIIANPPSFAHIHIAEKMGIPLHMMFTMPWTPTQSFPHPLANIQSSNADTSLTNFMSYALVDLMTWQGLGDLINKFREKTLQLEPVSLMWAPGMLTRLRIPYTYCWSPALIPKPKDWGNYCHISGFFFLQLASSFTPEPALAEFLGAGPPPVYIGFGSIVVDDPTAMTRMIFDAIKKSGVRALVSKGWGGLGADELGIPDGVFMLGNVPHDWLFKHVSAVVHHGGAGTTAAGIAAGKPTVVIPFFGDQPFWGAMTARAGAGPKPIPYKQLDADTLAGLITEALKPNALEKAKLLGQSIAQEKGADVGAKNFHDRLQVEQLRCSLAPSRAAVWRVKRTNVRLSALAATVLGNEGLLDFGDLKLYRPREYEVEDGPWDPITGGASALISTLGGMAMGFADFPVEILKLLRDTRSGDHEKEKSGGVTPTSPSSEQKEDKQSCNPFHHRNSSLSILSSKSGRSTPPLRESGTITPVLSHQTSHGSTAPTISDERASSEVLSESTLKGVSRTNSQGITKTESNKIPLEAYIGAGKGASRIVGTAMKSPLDFTLSLAKGFHNAPKLYGDDTVRQADKVTGLESGLRAAGKEFGYGMYDGISGLVTQPMKGAKQEGVAGFVKGIGKGIGGVVLKPGAAIWGLPGYTFQGIYQEIQKHLGSSAQNFVIAARTAQGYEDWKTSTPEERVDIVRRWHAEMVEVRKPKHPVATDAEKEPAHGFLATRHLSFDERKKLKEDRRKWKATQKGKGKDDSKAKASNEPSSPPAISVSSPLSPSGTIDPNEVAVADLDEFENAIQRSITATSQGDPVQDKIIERAIRATVDELRRSDPSLTSSAASASTPATSDSKSASAPPPAYQSGDALDNALRKGVSEVHRKDGRVAHDSKEAESEETIAFRKALRASLEDHKHQGEGPSDSDDGDEEDFRRALEESKKAHLDEMKRAETGKGMDEEELKRVLEESKHEEDLRLAMMESAKGHTEKEDIEKKARDEEQIVLEYVKKQSLVEEEHRKASGAKGV